MHLGNLKKMHIKTYCIVINTVMSKGVSARKEETIMNLIGMIFSQESITWDRIGFLTYFSLLLFIIFMYISVGLFFRIKF